MSENATVAVTRVQEATITCDSISGTLLKLSPEVAVKILTLRAREPDLQADPISGIGHRSVNPKHDANQNFLRADSPA